MLEKMCLLGWALRLLKLIPSLQSISAYESGGSSQLLQYLPACFHTFHHVDNGLTFETVGKPQFNHFLLYDYGGHGVSSHLIQ